MDPIRALYEDVKRKALMRLEYEGLHKAEAITTAGARFHNDPAGFAMDRYAYYVCFKCEYYTVYFQQRVANSLLLDIIILYLTLMFLIITGKKAYYGGEARCEEQAAQADDYDPSELVCGACSDVSRAQVM